MSSTNLHQLFGLSPSSASIQSYIASLASSSTTPTPEIKSYPDAVYLNYYTLGLSLLYKPMQGYKPPTGTITPSDLVANDSKLVLDGLDIYNVPKPTPSSEAKRSAKQPYATYPIAELRLALASVPSKPNRAAQMTVERGTTGKAFVECMGEPDRKGGGAGPSSGSIGIWCEWTQDGVLVEFGGDEARGPQAWERGKDAVWKVITLFPPSATA
jgi:hypothetical protein